MINLLITRLKDIFSVGYLSEIMANAILNITMVSIALFIFYVL